MLVTHIPKETVDCWLKQPLLDVRRLIPALIAQQHFTSTPDQSQSIRFLSVVIERGNTDTIVHNLLLTLLVKDQDPSNEHLLKFLNNAQVDPATDRPYYDLDYALRLCKQSNLTLPCIYIYSKLGMFESSVDLALTRGDLELAKENADKPENNDDLRRQLWLKIAKHVIQEQQDIKRFVVFFRCTFFPGGQYD